MEGSKQEVKKEKDLEVALGEEASKGQAAPPTKKGGLAGFFTGPYFRIIPPSKKQLDKHERAKAQDILQNSADVPADDYLGALKRIILNRLDTDGHYGLTDDELVPLPFEAPKAYEYLVDFAAGTYLVAQATVVMFIAILVDNDERGVLLGSSYQRYLPIVKALVILYPLVTLIVMCALTCEYLVRKYMYYRLLSMRILVDWENKEIYQGWFFYYFIATWVLLNVWSLYGVVKFWPMGVSSGADTVPFATWVVVNLQTVQLLLYYYRLLNSEQRLVSLNSIFERAPVEAQMLLSYTYVIEESVLVEECLSFGFNTVKAFRRRVANVLSCGYLHKDWHTTCSHARFDLDNLKGNADNYASVEDMISRLRDQLNAEAEHEAALHGADVVKLASGALATDVTADGRVAAYQPPDWAAGSSTGPAPPAIAVMDAAGCTHHHDERPSRASRPTSTRKRRKSWDADADWWERLERRVQLTLYRNFYATVHGAFTAVMVHFPSWPYRGDVAYFRMLLFFELLGFLSVAAIVVFGVLRATKSRRCGNAVKECDACYKAVDTLGTTCQLMYNIIKTNTTGTAKTEL